MQPPFDLCCVSSGFHCFGLLLTLFFDSFTPVPLQEVSTLLLAASVMGDKMSLLNWLGFAVCLCGISLHVGLKAHNSKRKCRLLRLGKRGNGCFGTRCASTRGRKGEAVKLTTLLNFTARLRRGPLMFTSRPVRSASLSSMSRSTCPSES